MFPQEGKRNNKSQLDQLQEVIGSRRIDVLLISIGGNDIGWSGIFEELVTNEVHSPSGIFNRLKKVVLNNRGVDYQRLINSRLIELRNRYTQLGNDLKRRNIKFNLGLLTEYPELLMGNELGQVTKGCGKFRDYPTGDRINLKESEFIYKNAKRLNRFVSDGALTINKITGENFLHQGGIARAFLNHGYCSVNPYFVFFDESCRNQGDKDGVMHPNEKGTQAVAEILLRKIGDLSKNKTRMINVGIGPIN